jgi:WD40 repeat protein
MLLLWFAADNATREAHTHSTPVHLIQWNQQGNRLITVDKEGNVFVWKVDIRGRMTVLAQYRLGKAIHSCLYQPSTDSTSFYLICGNGQVYYADESGHCDELTAIPSNPLAAYILSNQKWLVSLNSDLVLSKTVILADGKLGQSSMVMLIILKL